jgi:hypothetical protein
MGRASDCVFPSKGAVAIAAITLGARGMVLWDRTSFPFNLAWAWNSSADATPGLWHVGKERGAALRRLMASDARKACRLRAAAARG